MKSHLPRPLPSCLTLPSTAPPLLCLAALPHLLPQSPITHHSLDTHQRHHCLCRLPFQPSISSSSTTFPLPPHFLYTRPLRTAHYLPLLALPSLQLVSVGDVLDYRRGLDSERIPQVSSDTDYLLIFTHAHANSLVIVTTSGTLTAALGW